MGTTYKIKPGDNLSTIASRYGTTVDALAKANNIIDPNRIYANTDIVIPNISVDNSKLQGAVNPPSYTDYEESDAVTALGKKKSDAEQAVTEHPDFMKSWNESEEGKMYGKLIQDYLGREDFSYDFNADALYQQYKDKYIQQGKMAMADTIGQASAMTGGYGNSYAATVGNQAYQAHLNQLNDVIPELYQMAYDRHNQKGQDMLNQIALLGNERDFGYGVSVDEYNRLVADRGYYGSQHDSERNWDYGQYLDGYSQYRDTIADTQWKANFDEAQRQFNEQMAWEKKVYGDEMALLNGDGSDNTTTTPVKTKTPTKKSSEPEIKATKTKATNSFIATHPTKNEYMRRRNTTYKQYQEYIDAAIEKAQDSFSDEELMYLKQYYGL